MEDIADSMLGKEYPFFLGVSFFEFSASHAKPDFEHAFGMFGYGDCALSVMDSWEKLQHSGPGSHEGQLRPDNL